MNEHLAGAPEYRPGRTVAGTIKLASNESSDGPDPAVLEAIALAAQSANRYPDIRAAALTRRLAEKCGVEPERISVGSGSVALLQGLAQAVCEPGDEVVFASPSFEGYPGLVQARGARSVPVPVTEDQQADLDAMAAAIGPKTKLVLLATPNNPTGGAVRRADLERFLGKVPGHVVVGLDEAYREFVTDPEVPDGVEIAEGRGNVVVLRTFSKAYGLAGVRVGYSVAPPEIARTLNLTRAPFSPGAIAQAAALAALGTEDAMRERCRKTVEERERVHQALLDHGFVSTPSQANFVWLPLGENALAFAAHLEQHKVIVRPIPDAGVRVTIGAPEENDAFLEAARSYQP
nr:histidinol-phosphate transaminase [Amycolatopsis jejuensis]